MANFKELEDRPTWNELNTPKVMERMQVLYETSKWHDCVFKLWKSDGAGEELVFAHSIVLASSSPVFEALCFGPMAEKSPIEVPDIDPMAFRMLLKFIYTDDIEFSSVELACNVLYASKKYLIYTLAGLAISYISYHINESNCLQIYEFSSFIQEEKLMKESWTYLISHLDEVFVYFSKESLSTDLVKNLVNEEALNGDEIIIFKICMMWAEAECENNNVEKSSDNLRKMLINADILNKIRWLTLSLKEFEEGPMKSGILTSDEIQYISEVITANEANSDISSEENNKIQLESDCQNPNLNPTKNSNFNDLRVSLPKNSVSPFSINTTLGARKRIQLKKVYCYRFIEKEVRQNLVLKNKLKICTYVTANKSVRLTAVLLNAKVLPVPQFNNGFMNVYSFTERYYAEKFFIQICDSFNKTLFRTLFFERVGYGTVCKIVLKNPVILERSKEYKIQIDLCDYSDNYLFGVRNSISKFPSGLCVTFREVANIGENGSFVEASDLSIISGLGLCL